MIYDEELESKELAVRLLNPKCEHLMNVFDNEEGFYCSIDSEFFFSNKYYFNPKNIHNWYFDPDEHLRIVIIYLNGEDFEYTAYDSYADYLMKHFENPDFDSRVKKLKKIRNRILKQSVKS